MNSQACLKVIDLPSISASELLNMWEEGLSQNRIMRAISLLRAAYPDRSPEEIAKFSIGKRDASLIALRESIFGSKMVGLVNCPQCGERLEIDFKTTDLKEESCTVSEDMSLEVSDHKVRFRLPNSLDLLAASEGEDASAARSLLAKRCILHIIQKNEANSNEAVLFEDLPMEILDAVASRMSQVDPQADIKLQLNCPSCEKDWEAFFDIDSFLWREIDAFAKRVLCEVHLLAWAYGWREDDILAMSPWRRQFYLDVLGK